MAPPKKIYYCCVLGCDNTNATKKDLIMYKFPMSVKRRLEWINLIGQPKMSATRIFTHHRLCEEHFDSEMHKNKKLVPNAYPNINLPANLNLASTSNFMPSTSTDLNVDESLSSSSNDTNIKMEFDDVLELEKEIAEMESSTNILLEECTTGQMQFGRSKFMDAYESWQNKMKAKYKGYLYKNKFRLHCFNLYCKAPKAYPIFKTTFSLLPVKTLKKTKLNIPPGINENFIKLVGKQLQHIPKSKHIIVCLEEIPLKKHLYYDIRHDNIIGYQSIQENLSEAANGAFVISIKGCLVNYQQLIGYGLVKSNYNYKVLSKWINDTIRILFKVGLQVCAVVSKQTESLEFLANLKGISPDDPSFQVDKNKIYYLYDLPQMINAIRDSLMSCDFLYDNKLASWEHLHIFYQTEMDRRIRLAPKLTPSHLKPNLIESTQLKFTKDVFSKTVAAAMSAEIDEVRLPPEAQGTVDFFIIMNELINMCNSTRINHQNRKAYCGVDYQSTFLLNTLMMLKNIKVVNRVTGQDQTEETKCFDGIIMWIKAILLMYQDYQPSGLKYLLTGRLHLESEEMLNGLTQQHKRPQNTAIKLKRSFSALAFSHLLKNSTLSKYKANLERLILAEEDDNDFTLLEEYIPNKPKSSPLVVGTTDYRFELPAVDIFRYVCGYLLEKCSSQHTCAIFDEYLNKNRTFIAETQKNKVLKKYTSIALPPPEFVAYLNQCEKIFIKYFDKIMVRPMLGLNLYKLLEVANEFQLCPCFPNDYLKKLFLRMRIYNIIKFRNRRFKVCC